MIGSIGAAFPKRLQDLNMNLPDVSSRVSQGNVEKAGLATPALPTSPAVAAPSTLSFSDVMTQAISGVNDKMQTAEVEKAKVMSGETNNLHQAMLSIQEAGVAFSLMNEVRNKLVESYQEIMRMQV